MKRALCGVAAVVAIAGAATPVAFAAAGGAKGAEPKVTFCHATHSADNPYVQLTTANVALVRAHAKHGDFRIEPGESCPTTRGGGGDGGGGGVF